MNTAITLIAISVLSAGLASSSSQTRLSGETSAQNDELNARGLFIAKKSDAMRIEVVDTRTNALVYPNQRFKNGDAVKVVIESNFGGYIYILNVERGERRQRERRFLLFPYVGEATNKIAPDSRYELPRRGAIGFDATPGIEVLQVIMSHDPIAFLDHALKSPGCSKDETRCELDRTTSARAAELTLDGKSSPKPTQGGIVEKKASPKQEKGPLRPRDIILSPGKDSDQKSTYVAISDNKGTEGRLKSGDVVVFQILLEHKND